MGLRDEYMHPVALFGYNVVYGIGVVALLPRDGALRVFELFVAGRFGLDVTLGLACFAVIGLALLAQDLAFVYDRTMVALER